MLRGADAVVHLANVPAPEVATPATTFLANVSMNFNVFMAAARLGISRVVWASSETTLGMPFEVPPKYAPVDEAHYPYPTTTYALSKVVSETIAEHIAQWSGIPFIALRFSNIMAPGDYQHFPVVLVERVGAQMESLGICRRARRRDCLPAGPPSSRRCRGGQLEFRHRRRRHRHEPAVSRATQ